MPTVTRAALADRPRRRLHAGRNPTKAVIDVVEVDGHPLVIKDVAERPWPVRALLGPWQLDREERAYRRLAGIPGVPRVLGRPDRQSIAIEYVPGRDLSSIRQGELPAVFFDRLERILEAMHAAGVAHGDLHRRDVLQGPGGEPHLVDFATSVVLGPDAGPLRRALFEQMRHADLRAAAKLRARLAPAAARSIPPRPALYRAGAALKRAWDATRGRRGAR